MKSATQDLFKNYSYSVEPGTKYPFKKQLHKKYYHKGTMNAIS